MEIGRVVDRALLVFVDALAAGFAAAVLAFFLVPVVLVSTRVELAVAAGGLVSGVVLAVALALAKAGRQPFPASRFVKTATEKLPRWI